MKADIKKRWVDALRSGKFLQGKHKLKAIADESGAPAYCCLGVACEVFSKEWGIEWKGNSLSDRFYPESQIAKTRHPNSRWGYLPYGILRALGITAATQKYLAKLNDSGKSFKEIADYIETEL